MNESHEWKMNKLQIFFSTYFPTWNYMFKVNDRNTRMRCVIGSKLAVRTPERCQYFTPCSNVSVVNFEQVNAGWVNWNINTPILRSMFILKYFDWKTPGKQEVLFLSYQIFRVQFYINILFFESQKFLIDIFISFYFCT